MPKAEIRNVLLKLPVPLHTALKVAAARRGVTLAALLSEALQPLYAQGTAEAAEDAEVFDLKKRRFASAMAALRSRKVLASEVSK